MNRSFNRFCWIDSSFSLFGGGNEGKYPLQCNNAQLLSLNSKRTLKMKSPIIAVTSFVLFSLLAAPARGQEQTLEEFKEYVSSKVGGRASDFQLTRIVKLVDKDGDGKISQAEFDNRMGAFRKVMSGPAEKPADDEKDIDKVKEVAAPVKLDALTDSSDAVVLLITADEIAKEWLPFARWKTANGKLTKIITVGQIDRDYNAEIIQEKIRLCIREHVDNHKTKWVILGGDCLPNGEGLVPGGHRTVHAAEPQGIPTDIIYLSKTNWDADGDGVFGEFEDDRDAISYPDGTIGLGRIPVRTAEDVRAFTQKIIAYESNYPTDQFATNMVYTCTDKPAYPKVRNSWDGYLSEVWDGKMSRFFSAETPWDEVGKPGSFPLSAENVVDLFNQKSTGKLHIHGHGHLPAWVLEKSRFTAKHASQLKNVGAYPLITTVSCNTGEYDSKQDPSIVERLLRLPNAGSVAVVAPIRTGKPHFAKRSDFRLMVSEGKLDGTTLTMTRYWVYGLGEGATTGHAIMKAKHAMASDAAKSESFHLCVCELNLLGDPTLDMRSKSPRVPEIDIETKTVQEQEQITISTDAPNSCITIWDSGKIYKVATADKDGKATFLVEAPVGHMKITVSGANLNSKSKSIEHAKRSVK